MDASLARRWRNSLMLSAAVLFGAAFGLGSFTFVYAKGSSYLTDDATACANCHSMDEHFAAWLKSSHGSKVTCNGCHTPPGLAGKLAAKATNGFFHSLHFTLGGYPTPLRITPHDRGVTEEACRDCHARLVEAMSPGAVDPHLLAGSASTGGVRCAHCHRYVGHAVR
jgi:cytochrome c nitrite reductase small subunit